MTCEVKIRVVGHIEHGVLVADAVIGELDAIVGYCICDFDLGVSGETLVAVGTVNLECNFVFGMCNNTPNPVVNTVRTAVKIVFKVVYPQLIFLPFSVNFALPILFAFLPTDAPK